ncbi:hypothetical protein KUF71_003418 [Frankliniella fusca]|uniref:Reverse transcriptase n=1 Tax=Frankliniella fusca TaxID=407009 RepID=A0AAE1GU04_9NEOP|nr:hypothetical protein KUF71_003418 [Frankliniella fusca]
MQEILNDVSKAATWMGLEFNAAKCATLHIKTRRAHKETDTFIQGQRIPTLDHGEAYQHLGVPTGLYVEQTPEATFQKMIEDLKAVEASLLTPWQKLDAIRTFIIPQAQFTLLTANIKKSALDKVDKEVKSIAKSIFNLPRRASPEIVFIPTQQGGGNLPPLSELADVGSIVRAFKMLTCPDLAVREIAEASIRHSAGPVLEQREPDFNQLSAYLSGDATPKYSRGATIWSAARSAARRLTNKLPGLRWSWSDSKQWSLTVPKQLKNSEYTIIDTGSRKELHHHLRRGVQQYHLEHLLTKADQGKVFDVASRSAESNHFLQYGRHTRFCDWKFIHRARLGVLPLRACIRIANIDRRCRVCKYPQETTAHVLCHCMRHSRASNNRHRAVIKHLVAAMQGTRNLRIENTIPGVNSRDKPDLVIIDNSSKIAVIIDVACPFDNRYTAMEEKRLEKVQKYLPLATALNDQGFDTVVDAVVVGSLGSWDPANESAMALLGIPEKRRKAVKKLIVSDVIRWSRNIYVEHVSGSRQYKEDVILPKI